MENPRPVLQQARSLLQHIKSSQKYSRRASEIIVNFCRRRSKPYWITLHWERRHVLASKIPNSDLPKWDLKIYNVVHSLQDSKYNILNQAARPTWCQRLYIQQHLRNFYRKLYFHPEHNHRICVARRFDWHTRIAYIEEIIMRILIGNNVEISARFCHFSLCAKIMRFRWESQNSHRKPHYCSMWQ